MHKDGLTFSADQFSRIFPFFILINKELEIIACGNSLKLLFEDCNETNFFNKFIIKRPEITENNFENLKSLINQLVVIECINENKSSLRGQIEFIEYNNTLLFIGSPWFGSMEDVKKNNLNIDNFAKHDPLIDLLHVLKTQEITTEELKVLLNTVNNQKNELKTLSQIAEENINAVIITDKYGVITWVNKSFEKLTGHTLSESIGKKPGHMLQGPLTDPIAKQYLKDQIEKGESFSTEILNYHKNGNYYWLRIHGRALKNKKGEVTGYFATEEDISIEKEKEEELRLSEEKYRSIISNMHLGLVEVNLNDEVQYANQSFLNMSGYSYQELQGKKLAEILMDKDDAKTIADKINNRLNGEFDSYEIIAHDKFNNQKWWLISGAPKYDNKGNVIGSIGVHLDITEQKRKDNELRIAKLEAESSSKAKEAFLTNMSHEIRTPMNAILGITNELAKTNLDEKQRYFQNIISTASNNLLVIINDILDFSKIDAGKLVLENISFNLEDVINRVENVMHLKALEKSLNIKTYFDNQIAENLIGDPFRINQILINLVGNAIKFTDSGVVSIKTILIDQNKNSQKIALVISDTGIGMSEDFINSIYEKFTQENHTIARKYGGTGLGMSISKELIELMNGSIDIKSKKGNGTTITITFEFNIDNEKPKLLHKKEDVDLAILKDKNILLAEDNQLNRIVVISILSRYGAKITEAENGEQAIKLLLEKNADLVLMDIQMPVMDGYQATKKIRSFNKNIPIIALTANAFKGEEKKCKNAGMNDFVSKPFNETELIRKITTLLELNFKATEDPENKNIIIDADKLYDLSKMEIISNGDQVFIQKMLQLFVQENEKALLEITESYQKKDFKKLKATVHRIKPSIFSFNIEKIFESILYIEKFESKEDDLNLLNSKINNLKEILTAVIDDIKSKF